MPAADPVDQSAAREYEQMLRYYVYSGRTPQSKLDWFQALPKRVRRSHRLIDEALGPIEAEETRAREALAERQARELERSLRLAIARTQPRDLSCLKGQGHAWNGIGRRKKRCRAFELVGRAYNTRQRLVSDTSTTDTSTTDLFLLHPSSCYVPKRPLTPSGLREHLWNMPGLIETANGPANSADYGCPTPTGAATPYCNTTTPQTVPPPTFPLSPYPGEFCVDGFEVDPDVAYIVAHGRHCHAPDAGYSARRAAVDVCSVVCRFPGALEYLAQLLFPAGVNEYTQMVDSEGMEPIVDFVFGWFDLSRLARECSR